MQNPLPTIGTASWNIPASVIAALIGTIIILFALAMFAAYRRGEGRGALRAQHDYRLLLNDQDKTIQNLLLRITDAGTAIEQAQAAHDLEMDQQRARYRDEFIQLSNNTQQLKSQKLSSSEIELIIAMAEKLRLGSSALHATQQYADARQAKELAHRGVGLFQRLQPRDAKGEAA